MCDSRFLLHSFTEVTFLMAVYGDQGREQTFLGAGAQAKKRARLS